MRGTLVLLAVGVLALGSGCQSLRAGDPGEVIGDGATLGAIVGGLPAVIAAAPITLPLTGLVAEEGGDPGVLERVGCMSDELAIMLIPAIPTAIVGAGVGVVLSLPFAGVAAVIGALDDDDGPSPCGPSTPLEEPPPPAVEPPPPTVEPAPDVPTVIARRRRE